MLINRETDYAIRIVYCLSKSNTRKDANTISEETAVSLRFSLKILRKLVAAGFANSYKGVHGGYELRMDPKDISLYDVYYAINEDLHINRCQHEYHCCENLERQKASFCVFKHLFDEMELMIKNKLMSVNYANVEMLSEPAQPKGLA